MFMSDEPTVIARDLHRFYRADNRRSIFRKPKLSDDREGDYVRALDGVSFVAEKGECIGVLGRNGSGKSTLMRLIAGNEAPDQGQLLTSSRPTLLNVSAALQPRLPGITNIKLGLLAQGVKPSSIPAIADEITEFADIGKAIHRPMVTYSSGMSARLKFAISTSVRREILLIDEALATGDAAFTRRAQERMAGFLQDAGTIFLVSHATSTIKSICNRAIWLHDGKIVADGDVEAVTLLYSKWTTRVALQKKEWAQELLEKIKKIYGKPEVLLLSEVEAEKLL